MLELSEFRLQANVVESEEETDDTTNGEDGNPTAEEIAEDAGLLPFMSPFALVAMIGLAVAFAQVRRELDE